MNLNDLELFRSLDRSQLIEQISAQADQLEHAFEWGKELPMCEFGEIRQILAVGCGALVAGADCLSSYAEPIMPVPMLIWREDNLPGWARSAHTLLILHAIDGDAPDTVRLAEQAVQSGCQLIYIGGEGSAAARVRTQAGLAVILPGQLDARFAPGCTFGLLYRILQRIGLLGDPGADLDETLAAMRQVQAALLPEVPVARNPAKRLAGQIFGRWVMLFSSEYLAPVARRWKNQLNEIANSGGQFELIPEGDYNTLTGLEHPVSVQKSLFTVFLRGSLLHSQNLRRLDLTREICLQQGLNTDFVNARGNSRLAQMWTALLFGDFTAYYLAMANGVDPTPVEILDVFRQSLDHRTE